MSLLLAITTSTLCTGCALWNEQGPVGSVTLVAAHRHTEVLMPAIDQLCRGAGVGPADIEAVAVDIGPGLFTGLRVGVSAANSIALARGLPVVGVTSLEALAHPHRRTPAAIAAVVDARRSEVYWAAYATSGPDQGWALAETSPPAVIAPADLADRLALVEGPVLAVGDGARRYAEVLEKSAHIGSVASGGEVWPSPLVVAELAAARLAGRADALPVARPGSLVQPLYLRQADVRIGWEQVGGRVAPPAPTGS